MHNFNSLRRFPTAVVKSSVAPADTRTEVHEWTPNARLGLRGNGVPNWLATHGFSFPERINTTASLGAMRIVRLGHTEVLILPPPGTDSRDFDRLREASMAAPDSVYDAFRHETWSWLRISGGSVHDAMSRLTAVDLRPSRIASGDVFQTRVAGLDAVLLVADAGHSPVFDIFSDIASYSFFTETLIELCPGLELVGKST